MSCLRLHLPHYRPKSMLIDILRFGLQHSRVAQHAVLQISVGKNRESVPNFLSTSPGSSTTQK